MAPTADKGASTDKTDKTTGASTDKTTGASTVPVKEVDHLDVDPVLRGQNFACISFVSPEDALRDKAIFLLSRFLGGFSADMNAMLGNLEAKYPGDAELFRVVRENHDYIFNADKMQEQHRFFIANRAGEAEREFHEARNFQTTIRGFKIRGVFDTLREAQVRSEVLKRSGDRHSIYICQVGAWCPWSPNPDDVADSEYAETQLNTLMKAYKDQESTRDEEYARRKQAAITKNVTESPDVWVERKKSELAAGATVTDAEGKSGAPSIAVESVPDPNSVVEEGVYAASDQVASIKI